MSFLHRLFSKMSGDSGGAAPSSLAATAGEKFLSFAGLNSFLSKLKSIFSGKSKVHNMTLSAASWTGEETFQASLSVGGVTANTIVEVLLSSEATDDQIAAWQSAGIIGGVTGSGNVTIRSIGSKPETDIPITVIVRGDI